MSPLEWLCHSSRGLPQCDTFTTRHSSLRACAQRQGISLSATLKGDRLILASHYSPKSDDVYFKKVRNKIYFKVPVIPPRRFAEVKESPCSGHRMSTLRRPLDEQPAGCSRHDIYFTKCHPSMCRAHRQGVSLR
jgi:hypothetical protein